MEGRSPFSLLPSWPIGLESAEVTDGSKIVTSPSAIYGAGLCRESHHGIVPDPPQSELADVSVQREVCELRLGSAGSIPMGQNCSRSSVK